MKAVGLATLIDRELAHAESTLDTKEAGLGYGVHAPPRVTDVTAHWTEPPPERSLRCAWWVERIKLGWRGNRRTRSMGYHESAEYAEYFGVWIWEWLNVLSPMLYGA